MKVLELFSGIGGMHFALKESGINAEIVAAVDINTVANTVYSHNFPKTKLYNRNIQSFSLDDFDKISPNIIVMSPPCQPFTRVGLKKDIEDCRSCALLHLFDVLPKMNMSFKYLLVENVKGFETSDARYQLIKCLEEMDFTYQEFILCPTQIGIPNSRSRYYLIAKRAPLQFTFPVSSKLLDKLPEISDLKLLLEREDMSCVSLSDILAFGDGEDNASINEDLIISDNVLEKRGKLMDIVSKDSKRSCCFTKSYGHFIEGTGSVYSSLDGEYVKIIRNKIDKNDGVFLDNMRMLNLRYFSPKEISMLMKFPEEFSFPSIIQRKQKYRLLGNSINVNVVAILLKIMLHNDKIS